jgi:hypothetical protein
MVVPDAEEHEVTFSGNHSLFFKARRHIQRTWHTLANNGRLQRLGSQIHQHSELKPGQRPVVFFNASTRLSGLSLNAGFSLLTAWTLQLEGTPVIHFVCDRGMSRCVLGTSRDDPLALPPCASCILQSHQIYHHSIVRKFRFHGDAVLENEISRLTLEQLTNYYYQDLPLGRLVLPSLRWILRIHHLADDDQTRYIYRQYILSAWNIAQKFDVLLQKSAPQAVVVFNGMFYPESTARWVAQQHGIRTITHEVGLRPFTGFFTDGEATAYPIDIPPAFELTAVQEKKLDEYLAHRFEGNFTMGGIQFWPEIHTLGEEFWNHVAEFKQVVPVFTNVVFDTSQGHANVVFENMFDWLDKVMESILAHPDTFFVIRAHPDEMRLGKESRESVAAWVKNRQVDALPNVLFVDANEYFSSYELIQRSKFVVVYNSTIGLEASIMGKPVLSGGKARYTQLPTVFFPESVELFGVLLEKFLSEDINNPPEYQINARRFLYYQIFRSSLEFGDFLQEDPIWRGYVRLRNLTWHKIISSNSATLHALIEGILYNGDFLVKE